MYQSKRVSKKLLQRVMAGVACGAFCFSSTGLAAEEATSESSQAAIQEYMLEDIVVTAQRIPTKKMDTPARVDVITATEIEDNHYKNLAEAINNVSAVFAETAGSTADIRINGDDRVLVLVDGRRMNDFQAQGTGRGTFHPAMLPSLKNVERIEIVRGGGSALYGSDAVGGVVNIITKKVTENRTSLDLSWGNWGTQNYEIANQGSDGRLSWLVTAGLYKRSSATFKVDGVSKKMNIADKDDNNITVNLRHKIDDSSSVGLDVMHTTVNEGQWYNTLNESQWYKDYPLRVIYNNIAATYRFKEDKDTPGVLRVYNNYKGYFYTSPSSTRTVGVDYQNGWKLGENNTLVVGAEYYTSKTNNIASGIEDKKLSNMAVYLQDTIKFGDKLSFVPGVRYDHHNKYGNRWSPKAALNYNADDKTQVFVSWGKFFKSPTADDLYYKDAWMSGNPNLKPESGHTTTFGIAHNFDDKTNIQLTLFKSKLNDAIAWAADSTGAWTPMNINNVDRKGLDLSFEKKFGKFWSVDVAYSYTGVKSNVETEARRNKNPNGYRLGIHFKNDKWRSNLLMRHNSGLDGTYFLKRTATIVDFNLSYEYLKDSSIYFKVNNLFNREYSEYPGAVGGRYPGMGRTFLVGVTYSF